MVYAPIFDWIKIELLKNNYIFGFLYSYQTVIIFTRPTEARSKQPTNR